MHTGPEVVKKYYRKISKLKVQLKDLGRSMKESTKKLDCKFCGPGVYEP